MPVQRKKKTGSVKKTDSIRKQWTHQRLDGRAGSKNAAPRGSHFAVQDSLKPSSVQRDMSSDAIKTVEVSPQAAATVQPQPPHALASLSPEQQNIQRHIKITGASGEMPAIPLRLKHSPALPYSRYNKRYTHHPETVGSSVFCALLHTPKEGAPAYGWTPFAVYGIAGAVVTLAWCVATKVMNTGVPSSDSFEMTVGLALLCLVVCAGIVLAVVTTLMTLKGDEDSVKIDVLASALGKTALMMLADAAVWVLAMAFITGFSA